MKPVIAVLLLIGLAACGHTPRIVGAPPPGISYRIENGSTTETDQRAAQYCQQFDKRATLQSVNRDSDASIAEYDCS